MIEELIIRTLCDTLPRTPVDAVFLFGQTEDNEHAAFVAARLLVESKLTGKVLCLGTKAMSGYPGYESWKQEIAKLGILEPVLEPVAPIPPDTELLHTFIEAQSMVRHAQKQQYKRIIVTAAPFQQPRAFMTAVTMALREYPDLYLYSLPGQPLPWQEEVTHSQGQVQGTRAELIEGEMDRIKKYYAKGDLASVDEVLDYLNRRDKGAL
ncbi:YdcF family protein [Pontibacter vulgaris]|uniref:YdcF family protein n=1 Tax=Pontibacter vulgaris TaxID=2905679 RepID=UPI001FA77408|nr:YdcF family protein [Pontibacter vulgaris]